MTQEQRFNKYQIAAIHSIEAIAKRIKEMDDTYTPEMAYASGRLKAIEDFVCQTGEYAEGE